METITGIIQNNWPADSELAKVIMTSNMHLTYKKINNL